MGLHGAWLGLDAAREIRDLVVEAASFGHQLADLAIGMHDSGVVAATERLTDLGQRQVGEFPAQVHGDLTRLSQGSRLAGTA